MPSKWRVRKVFRPLVLAVAGRLAKAGMTPNQATGTMLACSIAAMAWFLLVPWYYPACIGFGALVFLAGIMDGVDGSIARLRGMQTRFGAVLDSTTDRVSDALVFLAPAIRDLARADVVQGGWLNVPLLDLVPAWTWSFLLFTGAYMTSYVRARVALADPAVDTDVGLLGRSERLLALVIGSMLALPWLTVIVLCVLANATSVHRLAMAKRAITEPPAS